MFSYPSLKVTRYFANLTYGYIFGYNGAWAGPPSYFSTYKMTGVSHGADLYYLLYVNGSSQYVDHCTPNIPNLEMKNQMVKWWTTFAKTSIPDPTWKKISDGGYLVIDWPLSTMNITAFEGRFYDFWANMKKPPAGSSADYLKLSFFVVLAALLSLLS
uniref:Carboxylesterase type B domain-containing protein n=1 Tax=Graphocephala atropunctata TaxID=36148 RepID=A0A1B6MQY3_9HEMI